MSALSAVVVIATYNRPQFTGTCLQHLAAQSSPPRRIVVVDASPDLRTREVVAAHPGVEYRRNDRGIGATATSRAIGVADASEDIIAFIDDDAFAEPAWLEELLKPFQDDTVAAVGGRAVNGQPDEERLGADRIGLLLPDGRLTGYFAADPGRIVDVDHVLGANMAVRADVVRDLGGIRDLYPGTCLREETDIALRMRRAGHRIVYTPWAVVRHVAGDYARGRRFDARYRYYGARNHVVLLTTTLGWRDRRVRRYAGAAARQAGEQVVTGLSAARDRGLRRPASSARAVVGGAWRAIVEVAGTVAGIEAAIAATRVLRRADSGTAA